LYRFKSFNAPWIYSEQLAMSLGVTAAQVRKDFSFFGVTGKRKSGYQVEALIEKLDEILGKNGRSKAIIAGFGPMGKTLYQEYFMNDPGIEIVAAFDNPAPGNGSIDPETRLPLMPLSSLVNFASANRVRYGIIAFSGGAAQQALDFMVLAGIKGIISLSAIDLKCPKTCVVNGINPLREMENVLYFSERLPKNKRGAGEGKDAR
jgi:redox-sensing transcriptional repressor